MVDFVKKTAARAMAKDAAKQIGLDDSNSDYSKSPIQWTNYNFPRFLRLAHYSTTALKNPILRQIKIMHLAAILIVVVCFVNCKLSP